MSDDDQQDEDKMPPPPMRTISTDLGEFHRDAAVKNTDQTWEEYCEALRAWARRKPKQ